MLTKISMWDDEHGWQHTTADVVSLQFQHSIPADSEIFLCELCGQYATFVNGGHNRAHFKHPKDSDDCDEKMTSNSRRATNPLGFSLPLRIKLDKGKIEVFIGFLPLSDDVLVKAERTKAQLTISAGNTILKQYNIDSSRLSSEKVSYLSVGNNIFPTYQLLYDIDGYFKHFWPTAIDGFNSKGTLFDAESGKRLPQNASVVVKREYLLIVPGNTTLPMNGESSDRILSLINMMGNYWMYTVEALNISRSAADFFLKYGVRLTDNLAELTQLYPFAIKSSHVLLHQSEQVWFHKSEGYVEAYPSNSCYGQNQQIFTVQGVFQQILSVSRFESHTSVLRYIMLRKVRDNELPRTDRTINVKVCNSNDKPISGGEYETLPAKRSLYVLAEYDGRIDVLKDKTVVNRIAVTSGDRIFFDVELNRTYRIYQGLDCVYEIAFVRKKAQNTFSDEQTLQKLKAFKGQPIAISHTFGSVMANMVNMPLTRIWLLRQINSGIIDRQAKEYIKQVCTR